MTWLSRLKKISEHTKEGATKPTKPASTGSIPSFVGFVAPILVNVVKNACDREGANDPAPTSQKGQELPEFNDKYARACEDALLTGWNVTIPEGTSMATIAKFRAASLALDAVQALHGCHVTGADTVPTPKRVTDTDTARLALFTQKGVNLEDAQSLVAQAARRDSELGDWYHSDWRSTNVM
jgi:hypothetical protein